MERASSGTHVGLFRRVPLGRTITPSPPINLLPSHFPPSPRSPSPSSLPSSPLSLSPDMMLQRTEMSVRGPSREMTGMAAGPLRQGQSPARYLSEEGEEAPTLAARQRFPQEPAQPGVTQPKPAPAATAALFTPPDLFPTPRTQHEQLLPLQLSAMPYSMLSLSPSPTPPPPQRTATTSTPPIASPQHMLLPKRLLVPQILPTNSTFDAANGGPSQTHARPLAHTSSSAEVATPSNYIYRGSA